MLVLTEGGNSDEKSVSIFRYARKDHVVEVIYFILLFPIFLIFASFLAEFFLTSFASISLRQ